MCDPSEGEVMKVQVQRELQLYTQPRRKQTQSFEMLSYQICPC